MDMGPPGAWAARARAAASGARLGPQRSGFKPCARSAAARQVCSPEALAKESDESIIKAADFVGAVNWGKLVNVGTIWRNLAARHKALGGAAKQLLFFMDLAEFEHR